MSRLTEGGSEMPTRFVVLQFDDGGRFDYEPPLPHPADMFLERFFAEKRMSADVGATWAREVDEEGRAVGEVVYPLEPPSFP